MANSVRTLLSFFILVGCSLGGQTQECPKTLSEIEKTRLTEYIHKKYDVLASVTMTLAKVDPLPGTCYRQLTFETKTPFGTRDLVLYLSPDTRFLTTELLDTSIDPAEEARRQNKAVMEGLTKGNISELGPQDAPVTIVEFSDFQCPYCAKFNEILSETLPSEKGNVRVVFHHLPLPGHGWARPAAEGAACAQLQSGAAFWRLHDWLFQNQKAITAENVKQKLIEYAAGDHGLNPKTFEDCLVNQLSLGLLFQDTNLASLYNVSGTPTIFINGLRVPNVRDADELRRLVKGAEIEHDAQTNAPKSARTATRDAIDKVGAQ